MKSTTQQSGPNFVFKCHRDKKPDHSSDIYSVNCISFHRFNTFCSGGSDGTLSFWDKDAKSRLKNFEKFKGQIPISTLTFSPMGNVLAYATSYDWSRGAEYNNPSVGNTIWLHNVAEDEVTPKKGAKR